jgi:negative regulator of sigma E activity
MDKKKLKKGAWAAGGIALLAAVSALSIKGLKAVDKKLKAKREAQEFDEDAFEMADLAEEAAEEVVTEAPAAEEVAEEPVEAPAEEETPEA